MGKAAFRSTGLDLILVYLIGLKLRRNRESSVAPVTGLLVLFVCLVGFFPLLTHWTFELQSMLTVLSSASSELAVLV